MAKMCVGRARDYLLIFDPVVEAADDKTLLLTLIVNSHVRLFYIMK